MNPIMLAAIFGFFTAFVFDDDEEIEPPAPKTPPKPKKTPEKKDE